MYVFDTYPFKQIPVQSIAAEYIAIANQKYNKLWCLNNMLFFYGFCMFGSLHYDIWYAAPTIKSYICFIKFFGPIY